MPQVYVSIGSNQQPRQNITRAIGLLRNAFGQIESSPVYETRAVGFDGDDFLNLVVRFETDKALDEVGRMLQDIERQCGRARSQQRFAPRTMDLDLLLYDDLVRHDEQWDIPRHEITEYAFVARPLAELAPDGRHPENGLTFAQIWQQGDFSGQDMQQYPGLTV